MTYVHVVDCCADTYVKTCLLSRGNKRLQQKKRTRTVRGSCEPLYREKIKYSACNVHGRYIQVTRTRHATCTGAIYR